MFLTGFADEAGASIETQIVATKRLNWRYIETRSIGTKNLGTLTDTEFDEFAEKLDQREDIKLFVKLPAWFEIETPIGKYNPDWAILKHDDAVLYLVRETKGTRNFEKLRTSEAEKVRCGRKHFDALGVNFDVVTSVAELD